MIISILKDSYDKDKKIYFTCFLFDVQTQDIVEEFMIRCGYNNDSYFLINDDDIYIINDDDIRYQQYFYDKTRLLITKVFPIINNGFTNFFF
jgi:hypothetical protein